MKEPTAKVPRGRVSRSAGNRSAAKPERKPLNQLSDEERQARRDLARVTSSGQGQPAVKGEAAAEAAGAPRHRRMAQRTKRQASKVLFFINGSSPTEKEYDEALAIGPGVVFRNARKIVLGAPLENCDGVAGAVPADYANTFPNAGKGFEVEEGELPEGLVARPRRTHRQATGYAPDDVRPGTVDDGLAHASGTGSSQPGVRTADPTQQNIPQNERSEARSLSAGWKSNKTPGALG